MVMLGPRIVPRSPNMDPVAPSIVLFTPGYFRGFICTIHMTISNICASHSTNTTNVLESFFDVLLFIHKIGSDQKWSRRLITALGKRTTLHRVIVRDNRDFWTIDSGIAAGLETGWIAKCSMVMFQTRSQELQRAGSPVASRDTMFDHLAFQTLEMQ